MCAVFPISGLLASVLSQAQYATTFDCYNKNIILIVILKNY